MEKGPKSFDPVMALLKTFDQGRLGHALVFLKPRNSRDFETQVWKFIQGLLCTGRVKSQESGPCGHCETCLLCAKNPIENKDLNGVSHPDFFHLKPEAQTGYSVEQIRGFMSSFALKQSLSENRVALIEDAELLSGGGGGAAHSLLKLLEEPRPRSFLILTTEKFDSVLPTLKSRCQKFSFFSKNSRFSTRKEGPSDLDEIVSPWAELHRWIGRGAQPGNFPGALPADAEGFWKDRSQAQKELASLFHYLWDELFKEPELLQNPGRGRRILNFFESLEQLLFSLKGFGQAPLHWSYFKTRVNVVH